MARPVFTLRYMTRFKCIADKCEDTCCVGMQILITDENRRTLEQTLASSEAERRKLDTELTPLDPPAHGYRWALGRDEQGACRFLQPNKLCSLIVRHGDAVIPDACALFPRVLSPTPDRIEVVASLACPEAARLCLFSEDGGERVETQEGLSRSPPVALRTNHEPYDALHDEVRDTLISLVRSREFPFRSRLMQTAVLGQRTAAFFHRGATGFENTPGNKTLETFRHALTRAVSKSDLSATHAKLHAQALRGEPVIQTLLAWVTGLQKRGSLRYNQLVDAVLRTYQLGALQLEPRVGQPDGPVLWQVLWAVYLQKRARVDALLGPWLDTYLERYWVNDLYRDPYTRAPSLLAHAFQMILRGVVLKFLLVGHPALEQLADLLQQRGDGRLSEDELHHLQRAVVETVQVFAKHIERDREMTDLVAGHLKPASLAVDELGRARIFAAAL